jgi:hypothetical protein
MKEILRQYEPWLCGEDGYPFAWHRCSCGGSGYVERSWIEHSFDALCQNCEGAGSIKDLIREQADHRCQRCGHPYRKGEHGSGEWSPCDERCTHGGPVRDEFGEVYSGPITSMFKPTAWKAQWRILTVHHLDEDKANCRWWNLAALCQRCHLRMQRAVVMDRPWHYEHSEWFQPYAAGFYAFKYLGEDLTRDETLERLDELLALERRWTQDALFARE